MYLFLIATFNHAQIKSEKKTASAHNFFKPNADNLWNLLKIHVLIFQKYIILKAFYLQQKKNKNYK